MRNSVSPLPGYTALALAAMLLSGVAGSILAAEPATTDSPKTSETTARIDTLIAAELKQNDVQPAGVAADEDFLRRITFDLTGRLPSPQDVTLFGLDPDSRKRARIIDKLLDSPDYARNWARYWRDVIYMRATDQRAGLSKSTFERWMTEQLAGNSSWDAIVTDLLTATGDVREDGSTALIFSHQGRAPELAAESSRIFLGIQIQCANCHDHPTDNWSREQFHQLAAFFPRIQVVALRDKTPRSFEVVSRDNVSRGGRQPSKQSYQRFIRSLDRNRDGKVTKSEAAARKQFVRGFDRLLRRGDTDNDGALSFAELKKLPGTPNRRPRTGEYFMPDLQNPQSRGARIDPVFFVNAAKPAAGMKDVDRRQALANYMTDKTNPWFAKAFVNRIWSELLGEGFYMPVDDLGPERDAIYPEVLETLSTQFAAKDYDIKWLYRTIVNTRAYQQEVRPGDVSQDNPFAAAQASRLRSDQLFSAITQALGIDERSLGGQRRRRSGGGAYRGRNSVRDQFAAVFAFDPSKPQSEISGTVPQALYMMNSPLFNRMIRATGNTPLARTLRRFENDDEALTELYLRVLSRDPSEHELQVCREHIAETSGRGKAFEDILWSLLNSTEFRRKR